MKPETPTKIELHQEIKKLQAELDAVKIENAKLYAANTELSRVDKRGFGEMILLNQALEAQLKQKAENGCCIVEHGWRISAEYEVEKLKAQAVKQSEALKVLKDALGLYAHQTIDIIKGYKFNGDEILENVPNPNHAAARESLKKVDEILGVKK